MKLTDIDLSSLAEVAAAVTLLEHVRRSFVTGDGIGVPLPTIVPGFVVGTPPQEREGVERFVPTGGQAFVVNPAPSAAEKLRGLGVDLVMPGATGSLASTQAARDTLAADMPTDLGAPMDAATVFGQSAAPLPQSAPASAGVAASPTAPAAPPASGTGVTALQALAPLPAPLAAAPTAPAAQPSPAGGVELDTDGLPWDARIHAGTKRKNADGRWTAKKGINDPDLVPRVVAQLRAQMEAGGVTAQSATPLPVSTPAPSTAPLAALPATSGLAFLAAPTQPALPAAQTPGAPQQSSGAPAPTTFQDFMTALTVEVQAGRVPIEALGAVCQPLGGVSALNSKPELIPVAWASLKAKYPGML